MTNNLAIPLPHLHRINFVTFALAVNFAVVVVFFFLVLVVVVVVRQDVWRACTSIIELVGYGLKESQLKTAPIPTRRRTKRIVLPGAACPGQPRCMSMYMYMYMNIYT